MQSQQETLLDNLAHMDGGLVLAGDGKCDSPGYCAKYGTFTTIETQVNNVLHMETVQSSEVPNSTWCEHEGLKRLVSFLEY